MTSSSFRTSSWAKMASFNFWKLAGLATASSGATTSSSASASASDSSSSLSSSLEVGSETVSFSGFSSSSHFLLRVLGVELAGALAAARLGDELATMDSGYCSSGLW